MKKECDVQRSILEETFTATDSAINKMINILNSDHPFITTQQAKEFINFLKRVAELSLRIASS